MTTIIQRGGLLLGAALLAGAASAQTFHNLYYSGDPKTNTLTSVTSADPDGYIATANFPEGAALMRLQANGSVQWTRRYEGPTNLKTVKVRVYPQSYVWIGNAEAAAGTIPILAVTDKSGAMKWARRIELGMNAEARAMDTDDISFWVGGTGWPDAGSAVPWIARVRNDGTVLWVRSFRFARPCQLNSFIISDDGGAVGVGQVLANVQGTIRQRMFAFKVDTAGNLKWARRYDADKVDLSESQQWIADITNSGFLLHFAGVITHLCTDPQSPSCLPRPRSILVATIDQVTGALQKVWAVYDQNGRSLWAYTIAPSSDRLAIGGRMDIATDSEALLLSGLFGAHQVSPLQGRLYGDGAGPFTSQIEDVAAAESLPVGGFVFATLQRHNLWRPAIVRTDQNLSADPTGQGCEHTIPLGAASVSAPWISLDGKRTAHKISEIRIKDFPTEPTQRPCTAILP